MDLKGGVALPAQANKSRVAQALILNVGDGVSE
jgi:hypothetical protein